MATKNTPAWTGRQGYPLTEPCYQTVWDAASARKYTWNIEFVKVNIVKTLLITVVFGPAVFFSN